MKHLYTRNRRLSKAQIAAVVTAAVDVVGGRTLDELSKATGISTGYLSVGRHLTTAERKAVRRGSRPLFA